MIGAKIKRKMYHTLENDEHIRPTEVRMDKLNPNGAFEARRNLGHFSTLFTLVVHLFFLDSYSFPSPKLLEDGSNI